jgi:hypothetical protein
MVQIKSFSVSWKRGMLFLVLFGFTPSGKEKVIKLQLPLPILEHLVASLQKAVQEYKSGIPPGRNLRYIG